jgi:hypothetical protein
MHRFDVPQGALHVGEASSKASAIADINAGLVEALVVDRDGPIEQCDEVVDSPLAKLSPAVMSLYVPIRDRERCVDARQSRGIVEDWVLCQGMGYAVVGRVEQRNACPLVAGLYQRNPDMLVTLGALQPLNGGYADGRGHIANVQPAPDLRPHANW